MTKTKFGIYYPTNGIEGKTSIWQKGFKWVRTPAGDRWENGSYAVELVDVGAYSGAGYRLTDLGKT